MIRQKKRRNRIIIGLISILLFMTVGYAAYNTNLNITGTSNVSNSWDIEIKSISNPTLTGSAKHVAKEITNNNQSASMEADLYEIGDSATYTVTIENKGSVDAVLDSITKNINTSNDAIEITFPGYAKGERLTAGTTKTVNVKIELIKEGEINTSSETTVTFNYKQAEGYEGSEDYPIPDTYLVEYDCTTNGGRNCTEYNEYLKEGESVTLSNISNAPSEKVFIGWNTNSNATTKLNSLAMGQSNIKLYAIYQDDTITFDTLTTIPSTSSITVVAKASSLGTITKYEYSIDSGEYIEGTIDNINNNSTYTFTDLSHNTSHSISIRVTSSTGKISTTTRTVTTTKINTPTFVDSDITGGKKVTITYPDGCTNYTCEYSTDGTNWTTVTTSTKELSYTTAGTYNIIAKVTDKTNSNNVVTTSTHAITIVEPSAENTIQKLGATVVTSGDGLYADSTESGRYIYKGANPSNYIEYNGETWRIYSIEPDGRIKITRSDLLTETKQFDLSGSNGRRTSGYCSQDTAPSLGCNAWAATSNLKNASGGSVSSFVNKYTGTVTADSAMLTYLNSNTSGNYYYSLTSTAKNQIEESEWNVGPAGGQGDTYTLSQLVSSTYEGKYKWTGKIALLTKSEYMRASSNAGCVTALVWYNNYSSTGCKGSDYLYNSSTSWWLISPRSDESHSVFIAHNVGYVNISGAHYSYGVRPALYLKNTLNFTGSGGSTSDTIYKIS